MAAQKTPATRKAAAKGGQPRKYIAVIGIAAIIVIIAGAVVYGLNSTKQTDFTTFRGNFNSAGRVAIYATGYNGTALSSTIGCATAVIESVIGSPIYHRNASSIDLFVINQTKCVFENGIGGTVGNYIFNSIGNCLNTSMHEPSIFINYSSVNSTVIKPIALYVSGNEQFLSLCGVAAEIS